MAIPPGFGVTDADLIEIVVPNTLRDAKLPEDRIIAELAACQFDADEIFAVKLALEEALTNAVKHGNCNDPSKQVVVRYSVTPRRAVIMVRDDGCGFVPDRVPDPTADENLERPCGRGLMLMRVYMTLVSFNQRGNEVWLLKDRQTGGSRPNPCP